MIRLFILLTSLLLSLVLSAQNDTLKTNKRGLSYEIAAGMGNGVYAVENQPNLNGNTTSVNFNILYRLTNTFEFGLGFYQSSFNGNTIYENEWSEISRTSTLVPVQVRIHYSFYNDYSSPFDFFIGLGAGPNFGIKEKIDNNSISITDKSQNTNWKYLVNFGINFKLHKNAFFTINYTSLGDINKTKYNNIERKLNTSTINMGFGLFY